MSDKKRAFKILTRRGQPWNVHWEYNRSQPCVLLDNKEVVTVDYRTYNAFFYAGTEEITYIIDMEPFERLEKSQKATEWSWEMWRREIDGEWLRSKRYDNGVIDRYGKSPFWEKIFPGATKLYIKGIKKELPPLPYVTLQKHYERPLLRLIKTVQVGRFRSERIFQLAKKSNIPE